MRRARRTLVALALALALALAAGCGGATGPATSAADTASTVPTTNPYTLWISAALEICDDVFLPLEAMGDTAEPVDAATAVASLDRLATAYREVAYRIGSLPVPDRPGQDLGAPVRHLNATADLILAIRDSINGGEPVPAAEARLRTAMLRGGAVLVDAGLTGCTEEV